MFPFIPSSLLAIKIYIYIYIYIYTYIYIFFFLWQSLFQFTCCSLISYLFIWFIPFLYHFHASISFPPLPVKVLNSVQYLCRMCHIFEAQKCRCVRPWSVPHTENDKTCPLSKITSTCIYSCLFRKWRRLLTASSEVRARTTIRSYISDINGTQLHNFRT